MWDLNLSNKYIKGYHWKKPKRRMWMIDVLVTKPTCFDVT